MVDFQGKDFQISLPDDVVDASQYVFVKGEESPIPPMLQITSKVCSEIPDDMNNFLKTTVQTELANVPNIEVLETSTNKRDNWIYGVTTIAWGSDPEAVKERRIYLFVKDKNIRQFQLKITSTVEMFPATTEYFAESIRTFLPD